MALGSAVIFTAGAGGLFGPHGSSGPTIQTIISVTVSPSSPSFVAGSPNGTHVAAITVTMSDPLSPFSGVLSVNNATAFQISGTNLVTKGVQSDPSYTGIIITATPTDTSIAPVSSAAFTVTTTPAPPSQTISSINLDGSQFLAGPGSARALIGHVTVTMTQPPAFSGLITQDNGNFLLVNTGTTSTPCTLSECDLRVGAADLPATVYSINITATPSNTAIPPMTQFKAVTGRGAPGAAITTYTFQNVSGSIVPAGAVYAGAQAFRPGDVPPGTHPIIREATTHTLLTHQWDQISTRKEYNDDNSWRHAAWTIQTNQAIPVNGTYTVEFVSASGNYVPPASAINLTQLCAAHDLNIRFTNVTNQDLSTRGSGAMTFNVCANINNTGRDAPQQIRQGSPCNEWIIKGAPVYDTSGVKDPLIYVKYYVMACIDPSNPANVGAVRHLATIHNSWMNVAAGSIGNAGNPGTAGFTNDPQMVIYRPSVRDGTTVLKDWSAFDATLNPASPTSRNIIAQAASSIGAGTVRVPYPAPLGVWYGTQVSDTTNPGAIPAGCYVTDPVNQLPNVGLSCTIASPGVSNGDTLAFATPWASYNTAGIPSGGRSSLFESPSSVAGHIYYAGGCLMYSTNGTPPTGMTNNTVYYTVPSQFNRLGQAADRFNLQTAPYGDAENPTWTVAPTDNGSGLQNLSSRICHNHWKAWSTTDVEGNPLWINGSAQFEGTLSVLERRYWEESGVMPPFNLALGHLVIDSFTPVMSGTHTAENQPLNISNTSGGSAGGNRQDIGPVTEWTAVWWLNMDTHPEWAKYTKMTAFNGDNYPGATLLNEATGRTPALNNGPPVGAGPGNGTPFAGMGALFPGTSVSGIDSSNDLVGVAYPLENTPVSNFAFYAKGAYPGGPYSYHNDHVPAFSPIAYTVWGDYWLLDLARNQAAHSTAITSTNNNEYCGNVYTFPPNSGATYAGQTFRLHFVFCRDLQGIRAMGWMLRNILVAAALGPDTDPERAYYKSIMDENYNLFIAMKQYKDCTGTPASPLPGSWSQSPGIVIGGDLSDQTFMLMYVIDALNRSWTMMRYPLFTEMSVGIKNIYLSWVGTAGWPTNTPAIWGGAFQYANLRDYSKGIWGRCTGANAGGISHYDYNQIFVTLDTATGIFTRTSDGSNYGTPLTNNDLIINTNVFEAVQAFDRSTGDPIPNSLYGPNELPYDQYYYIVNYNHPARTFQVSATPNGPPITSYTGMVDGGPWCAFMGGTLWRCQPAFGIRSQTSTNGESPTYVYWDTTAIIGSKVAGMSGLDPLLANIYSTGVDPNNPPSSAAQFFYDATIVVPP